MASTRSLTLIPLLVALSSAAHAQPEHVRPRVPGVAPSAREKVEATVERIAVQVRSTKYTPATIVDEAKGRYEFDCSGMAAWILRRSAPVALQAVGTGRPLAVDFFRAIARSPTRGERYGWQRLPDVTLAMPGDVLAWQRPPWFRSHSTGHVAFVVEPPYPAKGVEHGWLLRIADASKFNHQDDTRSGGTGFGLGTLLIIVDATTGEGTAYGWYGSWSESVIPTRIVVGRVTR